MVRSTTEYRSVGLAFVKTMSDSETSKTKPVSVVSTNGPIKMNCSTPCTTASGTSTLSGLSVIVSNGDKPEVPLVNGFYHQHHNNNNSNNNNGNHNGWTPSTTTTVTPPATTSFLPVAAALHVVQPSSFGPKGVTALGPRGQSPKRPNRYNSSPRSRGGSPNSQGGVGVPSPAASSAPPMPPLGPGQHVVHLHVNPGETISFQIGNEMQLIQGPATVRMVSNNSSPPIPMPVQVPPGHMVQQIVDENGTLRHVILSPQPPMAVPLGPPTYAPLTAPPNNGPSTAPPPFYTYHPAYSHPVSTQAYHPHHGPNGPIPPPPPHHMAHPALHTHVPGSTSHVGPKSIPPPISQPPPHQCNSHHTHQGPSPPPLHSLLHKDDRTQRQFIKLKRKLDVRQRENHHIVASHVVSPPTTPKKENGLKKYKDRNTSTSGLEEAQEDVEEARALTELLSNVQVPQVSQVTTRSAFLQWKPPNMFSENGENKYSEYDIQESEFVYEVLMSDRGKDGKYRVISSLGGLEYTLKNLQPAMEYHVGIQALLDDLRGQPSETVAITTSSCEPDVPCAPKLANRTKTSLTLKWNTVAENGSKITAYVLESGLAGGGDQFQEVFSGLSKHFKLVKLEMSTCYRFRLAAINELGKSGYSEVVCYSTSGSAPSQPCPPLLQEVFVDRLHLAWQERPNDEYYTLQMEQEATGHGFLPVFYGQETHYICTGLRRFSEYKFRLLASNEEGQSRWSDVVTYQTLPDRPDPPGRPCLKGRAHSASLKVSWDPPRDNGGTAITNYILEMDSGNNEFKELGMGPELEFNCDRLLPGNTYRFRVSCAGPGGKSDLSEIGVISTVPICPGHCSPPRLHGKPKAISVHLRWGQPEQDGGSSITDFEVDVTNPESTSRVAYKGRETDCVVAGLLPGRQYQFRVRAFNAVGNGPWSDPLEVTSGAGVPGSPNAPQLVCKTPHCVAVTWDEPTNNGAIITEYKLEFNQKDMEFTQAYGGPGLTCDVRGLLPATQYNFRVQAVNSAGIGPASSCSSCITPPSHPAPIPVSSIKSVCETHSVLLTWQAPYCNGSDIIAYNIDMGEKYGVVATENACEHKIDGLSPNTTYRIRIQAVNGVAAGPFSASVKVTTRALPPSPPRLECASASHNTLKLKWGDGRNLDFTQYTLEMETKNGFFVPIYHGTSYLYKVGKLSETSEYRFSIFASNDAGCGPRSGLYTFHTTRAPPPPPKGIQVTKVTGSSCFVEWQPVRSSGEERVLYQLQLLNNRDQECRTVYKGSATCHTVQSLDARTEYTARVNTIRDCREMGGSGAGTVVGSYCPGVTFVTPSKDDTNKVQSADSLAGTDCDDDDDYETGIGYRTHGLSRLFARSKKLTDQQWAVVILCGFTLFAVLVAVFIQKIIAYSKDVTS